MRKTDIGWNAELGKWICRAVIYPPISEGDNWLAYSKNIDGCKAGSGWTEQEAIDDLKAKLSVKITEHLGVEGTGVVPLVDISFALPFIFSYKLLGVEAPAPVKPKL